jgi:hypothetical protein
MALENRSLDFIYYEGNWEDPKFHEQLCLCYCFNLMIDSFIAQTKTNELEFIFTIQTHLRKSTVFTTFLEVRSRPRTIPCYNEVRCYSLGDVLLCLSAIWFDMTAFATTECWDDLRPLLAKSNHRIMLKLSAFLKKIENPWRFSKATTTGHVSFSFRFFRRQSIETLRRVAQYGVIPWESKHNDVR